MREKKKNMHFGSLIMSFESLVDITKKEPRSQSLIAFIGFNILFRVKNCISMDLWMKYGKWGEFLTQKLYLSGPVITLYAILIWTKVYLSWPQTFITYSIQNVSNVIIKPNWCTHCYLKPSYTSTTRKPVSATYFIKGQNHSPICHP